MSYRFTTAKINADFEQRCEYCGKTYLVLYRPEGEAGGWGEEATSAAATVALKNGHKPSAYYIKGVPPQRCHHCGRYSERDRQLAAVETTPSVFFIARNTAIAVGFLGVLEVFMGPFVTALLITIVCALVGTWAQKAITRSRNRDLNAEIYVQRWMEWWEKEGKSDFEWFRKERTMWYEASLH